MGSYNGCVTVGRLVVAGEVLCHWVQIRRDTSRDSCRFHSVSTGSADFERYYT
jgi:hypothetical protein